MDLSDLDACIIALKNEEKRQAFKFDFYTFSKLMDSVLPNKAAMPFLEDLKRLGKINVGATNLYGDERLDVTGAGAKVRKMIEDHLFSVGIDPKIPPVDLLSQEYKEHAKNCGSSRSKAYAVEGAIRKHIEILTDEDPFTRSDYLARGDYQESGGQMDELANCCSISGTRLSVTMRRFPAKSV